jgi:sulfur-oxidizing protein SoxZ
MSSIKIRTKQQGDITLVKLLIEHPMETGRRRDEQTQRIVPAHYITELKVSHNGLSLVTGLLSTSISRNPYFSFRLRNAHQNDLIVVSWVDNLGLHDRAEYRLGSPVFNGQE